ncbi:hypothetical protein [Coxiella-like endosymbiont of Rhipicephalus sanguineus]|uniref:hypothetical protein n=1 Tax=Coxiella-like endosymbiont of Rhipicephalus sanguineus TaxID=1955402 RepID=UPI00203D2BBC|nr:hypothetical protein [Coxiella-like endosymbiont of Rhipicephalus sanguineus]
MYIYFPYHFTIMWKWVGNGESRSLSPPGAAAMTGEMYSSHILWLAVKRLNNDAAG